MSESRTDAEQPPALFLRAAQELGTRLRLDVHELVQGAPVEYQGIRFSLQHHGAMDPDGLTLAVHTGTIPAIAQAAAYRQLLMHNAMTAAAVHGFFAMVPDTETVLLCIRFNLERTSDAADAVMAIVGNMARELQRTVQDLSNELRKMGATVPDGSRQAAA